MLGNGPGPLSIGALPSRLARHAAGRVRQRLEALLGDLPATVLAHAVRALRLPVGEKDLVRVSGVLAYLTLFLTTIAGLAISGSLLPKWAAILMPVHQLADLALSLALLHAARRAGGGSERNDREIHWIIGGSPLWPLRPTGNGR